MRLREVLPYKSAEEAQHAGVYIEAAIIVPFIGDKIVMCDNRWRGWEFPGGGVEWGESVLHAARRELKEETGAEFSEINFVNVVWLERGTWRNFKAGLYYAEVTTLRNYFDYYEIDEVRIFDELPEQRYMSFACEGELYQLALNARKAKADGH